MLVKVSGSRLGLVYTDRFARWDDFLSGLPRRRTGACSIWCLALARARI